MEDIHEILKTHWGYDQFRPLQEDIIRSVLADKDTLALMPTGGGKSICYQVPALARPGICLVISPLIALMKDQVRHLVEKDIRAAAIFSGMSKREVDVTLDNCAYGNYKFLYLSPERLTSDLFRERLSRMPVNLIAVDEAHCISQWGYDFRPPYLEIAEIRPLLPKVPVLAVTATATKDVVSDIQDKLAFGEHHVFQKSFERANLSYVVLYEEGKRNKLIDILNKVKGSAIVYVRNRKKTKDIAQLLRQKGISADYYHGGLDNPERSRKQEEWIDDRTRVMVCTNAFGMGIDKPDVRVVVHLDLPDSLEAYFQEAGRAGRDGQRAYAVLLFTDPDAERLEHQLKVRFPPEATIRQTYEALGSFFQLATGSGGGISFEFNLKEFCQRFDLDLMTTWHALKILEQQGWITATESVYISSRVMLNVDKERLYEFEIKNQQLEPLIKALLRSYGGLFDHFSEIDEEEIARYLKMDRKDVVRSLAYLDKVEVLHYEPATQSPQITFTRPRAGRQEIMLDGGQLESRKNHYAAKLQAVIDYAASKDNCRSRQLLAYFGELNEKKCGHCDVCLERNTDKLEPETFDKIRTAIIQLVAEGGLEINRLISSLPEVRAEQLIHSIQMMIDNGQLYQDEDNRICLADPQQTE